MKVFFIYYLAWEGMIKDMIKAGSIDTPDGPTSYFVLSRDKKLTLKQRIQKLRFGIRKAWSAKCLTANPHTMEELCQYIQEKHGFREVDRSMVLYEYEEMRVSFMMTHAPQLLGEYAKWPELKGQDEVHVRQLMEEVEIRKKVAKNVPKEDFDIEFHKYEKIVGDVQLHIIIEKKYEHIGGGASGSKKAIKDFHKIYKDIYKYYGVTEEDIAKKTKRYDRLLKTLAR